jgi:hypothetical protein
LQLPEADADTKGERWQFYFANTFDGKNKAWAERYAASPVRREQKEAQRQGGEQMDPAFRPSLTLFNPKPDTGSKPAGCPGLSLRSLAGESRSATKGPPFGWPGTGALRCPKL